MHATESVRKMSGSRKKKQAAVFVAMSGGVDSSVAALLLKKRGYKVVGIFMRCYNVDGCSERDAEDARRAAEHIGIPFYVWNFEEAYKRRVVEYMIEGYRTGITPNPDVMCNKEIKFGLFLEKALAMGADLVATGHYARVAKSKEQRAKSSRKLFAAKDAQKDQSYFLWTFTQDQLRHCLFPIGKYLKSEVREIARRAGLPTAEKKDSQGICFLGKVALPDFLREYIPPKPGAVLTTAGERIGEHSGAAYCTVGQRHIALLNRKEQMANSKPFYVAEKNVATNTIIVAEGADHPALYRKEIELREVNIINSSYSNVLENIRIRRAEVLARIRYRQPLVHASLIIHNSLFSARIIFNHPQRAVAAGQSAVLYAEDGELLGGGVIMR